MVNDLKIIFQNRLPFYCTILRQINFTIQFADIGLCRFYLILESLVRKNVNSREFVRFFTAFSFSGASFFFSLQTYCLIGTGHSISFFTSKKYLTIFSSVILWNEFSIRWMKEFRLEVAIFDCMGICNRWWLDVSQARFSKHFAVTWENSWIQRKE